MEGLSTETERLRLEGRAELLEASVIRYRALRSALSAFRWRDRVRANLAVLRETARSHSAVEHARDIARRHAVAEHWSSRFDLARVLNELDVLERALLRLTQRRVHQDVSAAPLGARLLLLERQLVIETLRSPTTLTQRNVLVESLLTGRARELERGRAYGELLERLFMRPVGAARETPLTQADVRELSALRDEGEAALEALWRELEIADGCGRLARILLRRASRAPVRPSSSPLDAFLRATFWRGVAQQRIREWVDTRLAPVSVAEPELFVVFAWLIERQTDNAVMFPERSALGSERAAVIELASGLWNEATAPSWDRLVELARLTERSPDPDVRRIADTLVLLLRVRDRAALPALRDSVRDQLPTRRRQSQTPRTALSELVQQVQRLEFEARAPLNEGRTNEL